ncbi:transposase [Streptomyces sp. NPDC048277]|uniref:transposase n=1 Tax=Streptomyces sp. NPDC048277 TaxID=3155027 RepID=UPI0033ECE3BC
MAEKRRKFDPEFRTEAVRIVTKTDKTIPEVAEDLSKSADPPPPAPSQPTATGAAESPCHHLIGDRPGITAAHQGLEGTEAVLLPPPPRALTADNGPDAMVVFPAWRRSSGDGGLRSPRRLTFSGGSACRG